MNIIEENRERNERFAAPYNPLTGEGCYGCRHRVAGNMINGGECYVPLSMCADADYNLVATPSDWIKLRCRHDFEFWAVKCARIKDKVTHRIIPFVLNYPQRKVLAVMENMRVAMKPVRLIMLKARQWGGSTLVQLYMAWYQCVRLTGCHSLICAHVKDTASTIRGMYSRLLEQYPREYWEGECEPSFKPFEGSRNVRLIAGRGSTVTLGSSESQDAIRGGDYAMAHLTEVAFWSDTPSASPKEFLQAICGSINSLPGTLIVLESTANGIGNYFHREWLRSKKGESDKEAVFIPWFDIEIYRKPVADPEAFFATLDGYETGLWNRGCSLEQIAWYRAKRRESDTDMTMWAEYPTTAEEAFTTTGQNVFSTESVNRLRAGCCKPAFVGELTGDPGAFGGAAVRFVDDCSGCLKVWRKPDDSVPMNDRYVVSVDIGGRSASSDWSVISVFDRAPMLRGAPVEVVAQWRGHDDHDRIAWRSVAIARWYCGAHLAVESNTLDTDNVGGDPAMSVLRDVASVYPNLYTHVTVEGKTGLGFHTNRSTKTMIVNRLIMLMREGGYVERDFDACDELAAYRRVGMTFGATEGCHDDIVVSRAIGLYVATELFLEPGGRY